MGDVLAAGEVATRFNIVNGSLGLINNVVVFLCWYLPTSDIVAGSVSNVAGPCEKFVNSTDQFYNSNSQTTFTEYRINRMSTELPFVRQK